MLAAVAAPFLFARLLRYGNETDKYYQHYQLHYAVQGTSCMYMVGSLVGWFLFLLRTFKRDDDPIKCWVKLSLEVAVEAHSKRQDGATSPCMSLSHQV